jgi:hypothetical protein
MAPLVAVTVHRNFLVEALVLTIQVSMALTVVHHPFQAMVQLSLVPINSQVEDTPLPLGITRPMSGAMGGRT